MSVETELEDMKIVCQDCGYVFNFSVAEQKFYQEHNFTPPKRCRYCRRQRKQNFERRD
jgi:DNA-directed RNA polymerase subunit RPC12/RpoP